MAFNRAQITPTGTLTGTPATPTSIAASGSATATFTIDTLSSGGTVARADVGVAVIVGSSAPTTSPTVQFQYSLDGTNYLNDGGAISVPTTPSTTNYYGYRPPAGAIGAQCVVTNGATNGITAWAQGNKLSIG